MSSVSPSGPAPRDVPIEGAQAVPGAGESHPSPAHPGASRPLQAALLLSGLYLLARVVGLIQNALITTLLPRADTDAYLAAFTLPGYLNYLVASGTLSLTFIPLFTQLWTRGDEEGAWRLFRTLAVLMGGALVLLTVVMFVFAPSLVLALKPGFAAPERERTLETAIAMTRIMLPAQVCFYLGALMVGVLNSFKRFGVTGWTGAAYNVVAIAVAVPLYLWTQNPLFFAWGILIGAFCGNFLLPLAGLMRSPRAWRPRWRLDFSPRFAPVRSYLWLSLPVMLSLSVSTADVWVVEFFASYLPEGEITFLGQGYRLMIAAQGILGQAAAVATFPFLASRAAEGRMAEFSEFLRLGLRRILFLCLPIQVLLIVLAPALCRLVYGYGRFDDPIALERTAIALAFFAAGLFAWAAQGLVARGFYALGDTWTPNLWGTGVTILVLAPACALLMPHLGSLGLALATTGSIALYLAILLVLLDRRLARQHPEAPLRADRIVGALLRAAVASAPMALISLLAARWAHEAVLTSHFWALAICLSAGALGLATFAWSAHKLGVSEWHWLLAKLRRRAR